MVVFIKVRFYLVVLMEIMVVVVGFKKVVVMVMVLVEGKEVIMGKVVMGLNLELVVVVFLFKVRRLIVLLMMLLVDKKVCRMVEMVEMVLEMWRKVDGVLVVVVLVGKLVVVVVVILGVV